MCQHIDGRLEFSRRGVEETLIPALDTYFEQKQFEKTILK